MSDALVNLEAEAVLLGAMLIENSLIDRVADTVDGSDFVEPLHGRIFDAIIREYSLGKRVSPVSIKGYFDDDPAIKELGGTAYLARLTSDPMALVMGDSIYKQVADLSLRRRMRDGLTIAATACADPEATIGEIINHADAALNVTGKDQIHQPTGGECFDELLASFDDKDEGVLCHSIPELDRILGPLRPKQLIIGAGRPGMGKTATALSYAIGAARNGHGVLFVSLEMSSTELASRMAADLCFDTETRVPFQAIANGRLTGVQRHKVGEARDYMHTLPFQVIDVGQMTVGRLNMLVRRHARRMAAAGQKLELVVVDYLQLLAPDQRTRSNYEAVSEVSRALKAIAKDHGVAVLALAQLSREVEKRDDKRPQLSDLRDSGQIEQDADGVLFLLRQEYYLRKAEPDEDSPKHFDWKAALEAAQGQIEFIVAKRRNGVEGRSVGSFHGAYQAVR
jgi:replicative DNA helicase